jgi:hypothetical protein
VKNSEERNKDPEQSMVSSRKVYVKFRKATYFKPGVNNFTSGMDPVSVAEK